MIGDLVSLTPFAAPLARLLFLVLVVYAAVALLAYGLADRMIFLPPPSSYDGGARVLTITSSDGTPLTAVHLPNPSADYTILYSHGNAEDLGVIAPVLARLNAWGFAIFAYDYRGYGMSGGRSSERSAYHDADAAYAYLTDALGVPPSRIIAYGRSVGSGPSVELARRAPLAGLVIESGFTSAFRVVTRLSVLPFDRFRNIDKIGRVSCPVLVMHGVDDEIVPLSHGRALYRAAHSPKRALWVDGAGHNDVMLVAGERQREVLQDFTALIRVTADGR
jgi:fermentation-respiration switch protein FrsA (DUF1100 family)